MIVKLKPIEHHMFRTFATAVGQKNHHSGRALIIKNYYIMCIITQIVVPITPKFVFVLTKFFTVINNSALYKKMFRHE